MIDSALIVMIVMYCLSISILGAQYVLGDVFYITLTNFDGVPVESHLLTIINQDEINERSGNIIEANYTGNSTYYNRVETFNTAAAYAAWEGLTLLTGTYIFNFLFLMGVPSVFVYLMVVLYGGFLIVRAVIGYVRGV